MYIGNTIIKEYCQKYNLISPFKENQLQPASYDLTLNPRILIVQPNNRLFLPESLKASDNDNENNKKETKEVIDPKKPSKTKEIFIDDYFLLPEKGFVLGSTNETIDLLTINQQGLRDSVKLSGVVCGKSSLARLGIEIEFAGFIDPGFVGTVTLEIKNKNNYPVILYKDMLIAQIRFMYVEGVSRLYKGKYLYQKTTTESRYYLNYKSNNKQ